MAGNSLKKYNQIYVALLILFIISVLGPELADILGMEGLSRMALILPTAFGIAIVKAYMVAAHFMHLKTEKIYAPYILLASLALMFVFFFGVKIDIMAAEGHNWEKPYEEPTGSAGHHGDSHHDHGEKADDHH